MSTPTQKPLPTPETHPLIFRFCREIGTPLSFFDLETTTNIVTSPSFGITEFGFLAILPDGRAHAHAKLLNPENEISEKARELTGLTNEMLAGEQTFGDHSATVLKMIERSIAIGFNSNTFDLRGIFTQLDRYNIERPAAWRSLDLREIWVKLNGQTGTQTVVAQHYGVPFTGAHRALADCSALVDIFEQMLWRHGSQMALGLMRNNWDGVAPPQADGSPAPKRSGKAIDPSTLGPNHLVLKAAIDDCSSRSMSVEQFAAELASKNFTIEVTKGGAAYVFAKGSPETERISGSALGQNYAWPKVRAFFSGDVPPELISAGPVYGANRPAAAPLTDQQKTTENDQARAAIEAHAAGGAVVDIKAIQAATGIKASSLSFMLSTMLVDGVITPDQARNSEAQSWLDSKWGELPTQGALRPLLAACEAGKCPKSVDFVQLRVAIASRKAALPSPRPSQSARQDAPSAGRQDNGPPPGFDDVPLYEDNPFGSDDAPTGFGM